MYSKITLFGNFETLRNTPSTTGGLTLSGLKNLYPAEKLGVTEEGTYTDILLVDGNILEDITLLGVFDKMVYE